MIREAALVLADGSIFEGELLGAEPNQAGQRDDGERRVDKAQRALVELRRRQDRPGLLVELQKLDDLRAVLWHAKALQSDLLFEARA